jgi:hypothetical protein
VPYAVLAATATALALLRAAAGPIRDVDYYWHLIVGQEILAGTPVAEAGRGWSFAPVADTWVSTQWLAEVVLAALEDLGGTSTALLYRVLTTAVALATLAWATLRRRPMRVAAWVYTLAAVQLALFVQERSQQFTYAMAPIVGLWAVRAWREGRLPRWWVALPLVWVWAQYHGGWVLAPAVLGLAALARLVDQRSWDRVVGGLLGLAAGSALVALVSPAGIGTLTATLRFSEATGTINEWERTEPWNLASLPLLVLFLLVVVAWARGRSRPTTGELILVLALVAFAFAANRNLPTAALVLAPVVVGILARAVGEPDPVPEGTVVPLLRPAWAFVGAVAVVSVLVAATTPAVDTERVPDRLLARIAEDGGGRVLNSYNVSGALLWFAGPPPAVTVGVDGRADRYGGAYLERYSEMEAGEPGWDVLVDELDPELALLRTTRPLAELLVLRRGWVEIDRQGEYVLLRAPDST